MWGRLIQQAKSRAKSKSVNSLPINTVRRIWTGLSPEVTLERRRYLCYGGGIIVPIAVTYGIYKIQGCIWKSPKSADRSQKEKVERMRNITANIAGGIAGGVWIVIGIVGFIDAHKIWASTAGERNASIIVRKGMLTSLYFLVFGGLCFIGGFLIIPTRSFRYDDLSKANIDARKL